MPLRVYSSRSEIPKGIKIIDNNDSFFNAKTFLNKSSFETTVLKTIDKAKYASPDTFIGRSYWMGQLSRLMLSTGTKSLLNVEKNPSICFNLCECGQNALSLLPKLKKGIVLLENPVLLYSGSSDCDILHRESRYSDFYLFLDEFMRR